MPFSGNSMTERKAGNRRVAMMEKVKEKVKANYGLYPKMPSNSQNLPTWSLRSSTRNPGIREPH